MPAKYILKPDGTAIQSDGSPVKKIKDITKEQTNFSNASNNLFYPDAVEVAKVLVTDEFIGDGAKDNITNVIENNPNFDFIRPDSKKETINSFKQMYSFQEGNLEDEDLFEFDSNIKNGVFATEFEILTGYRFKTRELPFNLLNSTIVGAISYFIGSVVRFAVLEAILTVNKSIRNPRQTFASSSLRLGTYTVNEFDIISKYLIERLNYPYTQQDTVSFGKNFVCFLIGFNEFISPDSFLDYRELSFLDRNKGFRDEKGYPKDDPFRLYLLQPISDTLIESALAALTNTTSLKRYQLLIKKFFQEKYWLQNQLYSHKNKDEFSLFFAKFSNYHFKFLVERVNVGIKIFERYYLDKTYDHTNEEFDHPLTRNSSNRVKANSNSKKKKLKESLGMLPAQSILSNNFIISNALSGEGTTNLLVNLDKDYNRLETNHKFNITSERRLSSESVREIEDKLECEYMPFYFHDVRTNEILPFHAFLESISDSFQPDYNASSGYGRIDEVRSYVKTTRNISFSFIVAAMCEEDHDLMWYNINKLVMMVYPQWSGAFTAYDDEAKPKDFKYPFTQVPTASPLVRIRVGDVIKSNYSRSSLARLHGVGNRYIKDAQKNLVPKTQLTLKAQTALKLEPGAKVKVPAGVYKVAPRSGSLTIGMQSFFKNLNIQSEGSILEVKDDYVVVNICVTEEQKTKMDVAARNLLDQQGTDSSGVNILKKQLGTVLDNLQSLQPEGEYKIIVDKSKVMLVHLSRQPKLKNSGSPSTPEQIDKFMKPGENLTGSDGAPQGPRPAIDYKIINPITKAYESGMSRGLAGFITNLTIDYNDMKWETTKIGSKAPMMAKVQVSFAPIHDIPPGLDENGMMRAPIYNTGEIVNNMFGDPHDTKILGNGLDNVRAKIDEYLKR